MRSVGLWLLVAAAPVGCILSSEGTSPGDAGTQGSAASTAGPGGGTGTSAPASTGAAGGTGDGGSGGASLVGNCALDAPETCDDCNAVGGDGCSAEGQVEPGWICAAVGQLCNHVSGVETVPGVPTVQVGDEQAQPSFEDVCPAGAVLVGLEATDTGDWPGGGQFLSFVKPRCAEPVVDALGAYVWQTAQSGGVHGGAGDCCVTNVTPYPVLECPHDGFVMGFRARTQNNSITTITLHCGPMTFDGQILVVGAPAQEVGPMGSNAGIASSDIFCPPGTVAAALVGSAGAALDRVGLRCDTPSFTVCGDDAQGGAEDCDDGNAVGGDGCSALCELE